jgi:hypothetical protein
VEKSGRCQERASADEYEYEYEYQKEIVEKARKR